MRRLGHGTKGEDWGLFGAYLGPFDGLIGDRRTRVTFGEIVSSSLSHPCGQPVRSLGQR